MWRLKGVALGPHVLPVDAGLIYIFSPPRAGLVMLQTPSLDNLTVRFVAIHRCGSGDISVFEEEADVVFFDGAGIVLVPVVPAVAWTSLAEPVVSADAHWWRARPRRPSAEGTATLRGFAVVKVRLVKFDGVGGVQVVLTIVYR